MAKFLELARGVTGGEVALKGFNVPNARVGKPALGGHFFLGKAETFARFAKTDMRRNILRDLTQAESHRGFLITGFAGSYH